MPDKLAAVIGNPVSHSLSPKLHRYWLQQYDIDGDYLALKVESDELETLVISLLEKGFAGFNVTVPHKEAIMQFCDEIDPQALRIGAVNTVVFREGKVFGSNTDTYGFTQNIRPHLSEKNKAVILGAGGASRAVVAGLIEEGFEEILIANRTIEKAEKIAEDMGKGTRAIPWEKCEAALAETSLLVNSTTLGMSGQQALNIALNALPKTAVVTDIVYNPLITPLLQTARQRGNSTVTGIGMLLWQAQPGFEAWFGVRPEVTEDLENHVLGKET